MKQVADIAHAEKMRRLVALLAAQTAGLLNYQRLSSDLGLAASTVKTYVDLLKTIYLIRRIPAWSTNLTSRAIATPKLTFVDSGMACHLSGGYGENDRAGALLETFVLGELGRQLTWSEQVAQLFHYRDRDGYEVDAVLENNAGFVIGIEVKVAQSVRSDDLEGLRLLARRLGSRFLGGFVLYCGPESLRFGDGLTCLPISALWTTRSSGST